jgi:hypothetical protein
VRRSKLKQYSVLTAVIAGAAGVTVAGPAHAAAPATLKLAAGDDAYVSSARTGVVFGAENKLVAGVSGKEIKTSFLKFAVPAGTKVAGARLTLTTQASTPSTVAVRQVANTTWTEGKLTAANAPALGSVLMSAVPGATLSVDLGKIVKGPGTYAFALSSTGAAVRFNSAEATSGAPVLGSPRRATCRRPCPRRPRSP